MFRVHWQRESIHELKTAKMKYLTEANELRVQLNEVKVCDTQLCNVKPCVQMCSFGDSLRLDMMRHPMPVALM